MALSDFTHSLPMLLYRASDAVMPRFRRIFNESGITEQQWRILRVLAEAEPLPMRDLAALCLLPPPSLAGIVDRLQKAGLVKRESSAGDRRRVLISLTESGMARYREIAPKVTAAYSGLMQIVGSRTWIDLDDVLNALCAALENERTEEVHE